MKNQFTWFNAWLKKQLGIASPSKLFLYGIKYEYDYLIACKNGTLKEKQKEIQDSVIQNLKG